MYEEVDLSLYLLLPRGMDLILPCLNYVPVHITLLVLVVPCGTITCCNVSLVQYQVTLCVGRSS